MEKEDQNEHQNQGGMGKRGVTRPMAETSMKKDQHDDDKEENDGGMKTDSGQRREMLNMHHSNTLWIYWSLVMLGVWMVASPLTFNYAKNVVEPSGGREVWLSMSGRIAAMKWSDIISGILLIFLAGVH